MTSSSVSSLDFFEPLTVPTEVADVIEELALEDAPLMLVLLLQLPFVLLLTLLLLRPPDDKLVKLLAGEADRLPLPLGLCEGRINSSLSVEKLPSLSSSESLLLPPESFKNHVNRF
jgi:hypothetical protein